MDMNAGQAVFLQNFYDMGFQSPQIQLFGRSVSGDLIAPDNQAGKGIILIVGGQNQLPGVGKFLNV